MTIAVFVIYLIGVLFLGIIAERYMTKDEAGFYLANRELGPIAAAISAGSSASSGWILIGAVGYAYVAGVQSMWMVPGLIAGYFVSYYILAPRIRRYAKYTDTMSYTDLFPARVQDKTNQIKVIASIIIIIFYIAYAAAQLTAAGKGLEVILGMNYSLAVIATAIFVTIYTMISGFRGVVWTDVLQGSIMLCVLILFPVYFIFFEFAGPTNFFSAVGQVDPILLDPLSGAVGAAAIGMIVGLLGVGLVDIAQPHVVARFFAIKNEKAVRGAAPIGIIWVAAVMTGSNLLGLSARLFLPDIADPDFAMPSLAMTMMMPVIAGIVLGAIFAAMKSTIDSQLIMVSQVFTRDIYKGVLNPNIDQKTVIKIGRIVIIITAFLGAIFALTEARFVFWFVLFAAAGMTSAFLPALVFSFFWKRTTKAGIIWGMIVGSVTVILWFYIPGLSAIVYEVIPGVIFSSLTIYVVSLLTAPPSEEHVNEAMRIIHTPAED